MPGASATSGPATPGKALDRMGLGQAAAVALASVGTEAIVFRTCEAIW